MPNRSMINRALKVSRAGRARRRYGDTRETVDGPVTFVAVFPDGAFGSDVPGEFDPAAVASEAAAIMPTGMRPVTSRVWWRPDDPAEPGGTGIAVVRMDDYGYDADRVYVHRVQPDDSVDVFTVWDKPHRVKWAEDRPEMVVSEDPAVIRATRLMFDVIGESNGFVPNMTGWLFGADVYGGRWYLAVEWDPYEYGELWNTVHEMDRLRRDYGADIRLYGTHVRHFRFPDGRPVTLRENNTPDAVTSFSAEFFTKAVRAFRTQRLYG